MKSPIECNLYSYTSTRSNPLKSNDPTGEWAQIAVGAVIGGVFSGGAEFLSFPQHWQLSAFPASKRRA